MVSAGLQLKELAQLTQKRNSIRAGCNSPARLESRTMTIIELVLFLIEIFFQHGNLKIRIFPDGRNFLMQKDFFKVDTWEGRKELHIE